MMKSVITIHVCALQSMNSNVPFFKHLCEVMFFFSFFFRHVDGLRCNIIFTFYKRYQLQKNILMKWKVNTFFFRNWYPSQMRKRKALEKLFELLRTYFLEKNFVRNVLSYANWIENFVQMWDFARVKLNPKKAK